MSYHGTQKCVGGVAEGCNTGLQRSISQIKHDLHRRNAQSAHSPAKPACGSRAQRLPRRAHVPKIGCAGHTRLGTRPSVGGGRRPDILGGGTCAHDAIGTRRICTRFFALAASSYHYLTGYCFWSHAGQRARVMRACAVGIARRGAEKPVGVQVGWRPLGTT